MSAGEAKALDDLLSEHEKHLTVLPDGRVQCELNGHTMPPRLDVVRAFVSGTKYQRLARAAEADASLEQYAPFIIPSANFPQMLYCALTGQLIERSLDAVRRHLRGKKWAGAKARFAADKQGLRPEPSLSEFGVRLPGEEGKKDKKKKAKAGSGDEDEDEDEDDEDAPMFSGSDESGSEGESGSGSDEEEDEEEEDEDEEEDSMEEDSEEAAAAAPPARGKKPARPAKQAAAEPVKKQQPQKKAAVAAKRGGAKPAPPAPPPASPPTPAPAAAKGSKKRNLSRPSKAKKARV